MARGIGVETMDTAAACRTYNILASEGRKVVAVLLIESLKHAFFQSDCRPFCNKMLICNP